jgi:hypothetical protein
LILLVVLAGCNRDSALRVVGYDRVRLLRVIVSDKDELFARNYIENVRHRRFEEIENDLDPGVSKSNAHDNLAKMAAVFPPREPTSTKLVAANVIHHADTSTTSNLSARNRTYTYIGTRKRCGACAQRPQCTSAAFRYLAIHMDEPTRQHARELANTPAFAKAQRARKKVEALFAELRIRSACVVCVYGD